jgi:putative membrane protein
MTRTLERRVRASRLALLALPAAATLVLPSMAWAANGSATTLRATIGGDGAVKSVTALAGNGTSTAYSGDLPVTLSISRTVQGSSSTYNYHVENTFSKTQDVSYTDTQGVKHTTSTTLQLPLVAQLGVTLPKAFTNVSAPAGVVTTEPDGTNRVLWNLVLFSPLGSPSQDLSFTVTGHGVPVAELAATAVNPATTAGLSQAQQDATASSQQDDFWQGYANGGTGGLTQLASGTSAMIVGLKKLSAGAHTLNTGLKTAGAGANKLDAGTTSAYTGSKKLSGGIGQIHTGQSSLTAGLAKIKAGLLLLDDKSPGKGVNAAIEGLQLLQAGAAQVSEGMVGTSPTATPAAPSNPSVLYGVSHPATSVADPGGLLEVLGLVKTGLTPLAAGLDCAQTLLNDIVKGTGPTGTDRAPKAGPVFTIDSCYHDATTNPNSIVPLIAAPTDPVAIAVLTKMTDVTNPAGIHLGAVGVHSLVDAPSVGNPKGGVLGQLQFGVSHPALTLGSADPGGLLEVLRSIGGGAQLINGGLLQLLDPTVGLPAALAGIDQLTAGAGDALTGSQQLTAGSGDALTGSKTLVDGLGQLATGQHQVATGLPAAVDGSDQIAGGIDQVIDGATKVNVGILGVQSGAVGPLNTQLLQGSQNAKKQVAVIEAAGSLGAQAPGGAGSSYVLTQFNPKLAASTTPSTGSSSNTGWYVGLGLGGLIALVIAVTAGFALGRRSQVTTVA